MKTILVADNDMIMRQALKKMINAVYNFNILEACNGQELVTICKNEDVDIIFTDVRMPIMDGIEAIKQVRQLEKKIDIYIITACNSFEIAQFAIRNRIKGYLIKPISTQQVQSLLEGCAVHEPKEEEERLTAVEKEYIDECCKQIVQLRYKELFSLVEDLSNHIFQVDDTSRRGYIINQFAQTLTHVVRQQFQNFNLDEDNQPYTIDYLILGDKQLLQVWLYNTIDSIFIKAIAQEHNFIGDVLCYIENNVYGDILLDDIVKACNVSAGHICRSFKQTLHVTITNYIHMKRINLAKEYLSKTDLYGLDISYKLGYKDFSYFCKIFKKYTNVTMTEYKANLETYK